MATGNCNGLSLGGGGYFSYPLTETTICAGGCGLNNNFNNLPPHYKATLRY